MKQQMNKERRRLLTNRILSVVLSVAMVWSAVPMSATAAGDASTDAKATATQGQAAAVDMGLSLSHAYIKHGGNSEATQSKKISLPTGKDFSFTAAPDTGYEITEVYTSLNSKPAGNSNKKVLKADGKGAYTISASAIEQGVTLHVTTKAVQKEETKTTAVDADEKSADDADATAGAKGQSSTEDATESDAKEDATTEEEAEEPAAATPVYIGETGYETIADALKAASDGQTITLKADVAENVSITKGITLDLNGHTLKGVKPTSGPSVASVITVNASGKKVTVTNGTVTGGTGTDTDYHAGKSPWYVFGGGIYASAGSLSVSHVTFTGNTPSYGGGAIYGDSGLAALTVDGCTITGNTATRGGMIDVNTWGSADIKITNTTIKDNKGSQWGAINVGGHSVTLAGNTVGKNASGTNNCEVYARATKSDSTVSLTGSGSYAGVVFLNGTHVVADGSSLQVPNGFALTTATRADAKVSNFTWYGISRVSAQNGALLSVENDVDGATTTISNVRIANSDLTQDPSRGSDATPIDLDTDDWKSGFTNSTINLDKVTVSNVKVNRNVAYMDVRGSNTVNVSNSAFTGNTVGYSTIYSLGGKVNLTNTTIANNTSTSTAANGQGIANNSGGISLSNGSVLTMTGGALYGNMDGLGKKNDLRAASGATLTLPPAKQMAAAGQDFSSYTWNLNGDNEKDTYTNYTWSSSSNTPGVFDAEAYDPHYQASLDGVDYKTINEAFSAATKGKETAPTVKLIGSNPDATMDFVWAPYFDKTTTIDLNGHNLGLNNGSHGWIFGTWHSSINLVNTSSQAATIKAVLHSDKTNGGDITINSNVTVDGTSYGDLEFDNDFSWNSIDKGTVTLNGTFNKSLCFQLNAGAAQLSTGDQGLTMGDGATLWLWYNNADDTFAKFNSQTDTVDDFVIMEGGSEDLAKHITVINLDETGKKLAFVQYDAANNRMVLHKIDTSKGVYVDGQDGSDDNEGSYEKPVKSMEKALEIYKAQKDDRGLEGIYVLNTVSVTADSSWDGEGVTVYRNPSFTGALVSLAKDANLSVQGMTVDGNDQLVTAQDSLFKVEGTLSLGTGATLRNAKNYYTGGGCPAGGAVYVDGGTLNLNSGSTITGNTSVWGGGIYARGGHVVLNDGAAVTNNKAINQSGSFTGCGGGIIMNGTNGVLDMNGGLVAGNYAQEYGGGIALHTLVLTNTDGDVTLNMNGGTIDGNTAKGSGGGIFVQEYAVANVNAGSITNNKALGNASWTDGGVLGGGIYVNGGIPTGIEGMPQKDGQLNLGLAVISNNTASYAGAGVTYCPSGTNLFKQEDGVAIYDNYTTSGKRADFCLQGNITYYYQFDGRTEVKQKNLPIYLSEFMLGGVDAGWVDADGNPVDVETLHSLGSDYKTHYHLNSSLSAGDGATSIAEDLATVHISGNYSAREGGGIGNNGVVQYGNHTSDLTKAKLSFHKDAYTTAGQEDNTYDFTLTSCDDQGKASTSGKVSEGGSVVDDGSKGILVKVQGTGDISLPTIYYKSAGTYHYLLTEDSGDDPTRYLVTVNVTKGEDGLSATSSWRYSTDEGQTWQDQPADQVPTFYNNYQVAVGYRALSLRANARKATAATVEPVAQKELDGQRDMEAGLFTFELVDDATGQTYTATNASDGKVVFDQLFYTEAGDHWYTIREKAGDDQSVVYDQTVYRLKVSVTKGQDGALTATTTYYAGATELKSGLPVFSNKSKTVKIRMRKVSKDSEGNPTNEGLYNAQYGLWQVGKNGAEDVYLGNQRSDKDGFMVFDVPITEGNVYYFKEEIAPEGHLVDPYPTTKFQITQDKETEKFSVKEVPDEGL